MINRVIGFVSLESRLLNHWQLPLTGLLLLGGLAATASTFKAATPQPHHQAINSASVAPLFLDAVVPHQQDKAVARDTTTSKTAALQPPAQTIDSSAVVPPLETVAPQQPDKAVDSSAVTPVAVMPQQPDKTVDSTSVASTSEAVAPEQPNKAVDSTSLTTPSPKWNRQAHLGSKTTIAQTPSVASIQDGIYLYGQSSEPQQVGKEYIVFEAHQGKVVGALYLPSSEFSCFHGTFDSKQLNLTVVNPYDQSAFSHTIARKQSTQVAAAGGQINLENTVDSLTYPYAVQLEGYQPISKIGDSDRQLLSQCRNTPSGQVGNQ